jgi:hypothetical protein
MNDLTMSILGFPVVNKDLTVELRDPVTQNVVKTAQPFLDGTVRLPGINPGAYEVTIKHPNLTLPVLRRPIRVLPTGETKVSVLIDPSKFRNTPIEDTPEANLGPISDMAASVGESVAPLTGKKPGEAILAQDWNLLANGVREISGAVQELTRVVSPTGHDHPEYIKKLDELGANFQTLLETLSSSLAELQRQIQAQRLRNNVHDVLDAAGIDPTDARGREMLDVVKQMETQVTASPTTFGRELRNAGVQLETKLGALVEANQNKPDFTDSAAVKSLSATVDLAKRSRANTYEAELVQFKQMDRTLGGAFRKAGAK